MKQKYQFQDISTGSQSQAYVDQSALTPTTGTPSTGQFRSSIIGRASIPDIANDMRASLGIDRVMTQQLYQIQNEQGTNGEPVWGTPNDDRGLIRFVGSSWVCNSAYSIGLPVVVSAVGEYIEIIFYGTGLNLIYFSDVTARNYYVTVDGGTEGSNIYVQSTATITNRNYNTNHIATAASGLALGLHTVKIRSGNATASYIYGFEILNSNASGLININPGTAYYQNKKIKNSVADSIAYTTGVTGIKGGRIVRYFTDTDTPLQAFTPVNASVTYGASADHTYEEVARTYYPREFGAGRYNATYVNQDDFSLMAGNPGRAAAFTLDDGTATLVTSNSVISSIVSGNPEGLSLASNSTSTTFTFVGCGLDLLMYDTASGGNDSWTYSIDGATPTAWFYTVGTTNVRVQKIVSGLPYGTHTFTLNRLTPATWGVSIVAFKVYQPKKPTLPTGAIEICDYNVMGNYDASLVTGTAITNWNQIPQGVLAKVAAREFVYVGANWAVNPIDTTTPFGFNANTLTNNNQPASYTFFGTGAVVLCGASGAGTYYFSVTVDSVLNSSGTNMVNSALIGSGVYNCTSATSGLPCRVAFTGLTLGFHTITVQRVTGGGAGNFVFNGLHIITPIHVHKSNSPAVLQNTLAVGLQSLTDSRSTSPTSTPAKAWAQAVGVTSGQSVSTGIMPIYDISSSVKTYGGRLRIRLLVSALVPSSGNIYIQLMLDGSPIDTHIYYQGTTICAVNEILALAAAGYHLITAQIWSGTSGSLTGATRKLIVEEI